MFDQSEHDILMSVQPQYVCAPFCTLAPRQKSGFKPSYYTTEIDVLLQHLNSIEPSIQFTVERETDRKLAFLDTCAHRTIKGKLETDVYRKSTHTDKYLLFNSHHPRSHKMSVATTLLSRAESLTSNSVARDNERQYVINVLKENNYPKNFLKECLRRSALTIIVSP